MLTGKPAKKQYELKSSKEFFNMMASWQFYGFAPNKKTGKKEKILYHTKTVTVRLNALPEKHRRIESVDAIKQSTTGGLTKESLTIPSIVRNLQYENLVAILDRVKEDKDYVEQWLRISRKNINRSRKRSKELVLLGETLKDQEIWAA